MRIAYLVGRYPSFSHTFITREIQALRSLGVEIETFAIWRTAKTDLLSQLDRDEFARTRTLLPFSPSTALRAQAAALRHPLAFARTLSRALGLARPGIWGRLLGLSWFLEAVLVWKECARLGIRHLHVHLGGTAPAVALLATFLGNGGGEAPHPRGHNSHPHRPGEVFD